MLVRDKTIPKGEYKGRPTEALDELCPCRPCYNAHNCERDPERYYSHPDMRCATRENGLCGWGRCQPVVHIYQGKGKVCKRCGFRRA